MDTSTILSNGVKSMSIPPLICRTVLFNTEMRPKSEAWDRMRMFLLGDRHEHRGQIFFPQIVKFGNFR